MTHLLDQAVTFASALADHDQDRAASVLMRFINGIGEDDRLGD